MTKKYLRETGKRFRNMGSVLFAYYTCARPELGISDASCTGTEWRDPGRGQGPKRRTCAGGTGYDYQ
jgi:hypothetical protein